MTHNLPGIDSGITWFYYDNFAQATAFYEEVLGFESVVDQGWAKIYPIGDGGFLGAVNAQAGKGSCTTQPESAVLLTLVVDDVTAWHAHLKKRGVNGLTEIQHREKIQIECFFFEDPGGYRLEIQTFLDPKTARCFMGHPASG
jgi:catechol 2,3-dioxygenase-like lactoylglutathione lyase family enzyme